MNRLIYIIIGVVLLSACRRTVDHPTMADRQPDIYPDYIGVTIPADIAPLDFNVTTAGVDLVDVTVKGSKGGQLHVQGDYADFDIDKWHALTHQNVGGQLTFTVCTLHDGQWTQYQDFTVDVSPYPLDEWGLTYRRIAPGYEVGGNIGIYQRCLSTFDEYAILQESAVPGRCFNCHTANRTDPRQLTAQIRGEGGGTLIQRDGRQAWLNTKTDSTRAAGSYAYWHPSGRYCAYAANSVHQAFYVGRERRIEVYHQFSHVVVLDTQTNELLLAPQLTDDDLEIFPAFSPDGRTLYYSSSKPCQVPAEYEKVKCSLCAISFDATTGQFGQTVDTLLNARELNKSIVLARPSYDGRWLMYCQADCGNFPVCRNESDLWLMDLQTRQTRPLSEVNSPQSESYHNWSANSRWFVFASKREDGMYTQLYLSSLDDRGRATKPFLLPQRNPRKFYADMMDAYNCPDFTLTRVSFDAHEAYRQVFRNERIQVKIKP